MKERRQHKRLDLESLAARLFVLPSGEEIDFSPINLSANGFSVYVNHALVEGDQVELELISGRIRLAVKWCRASPDNPLVYRAGLETVEQKSGFDQAVIEHMRRGEEDGDES